MISMRQIMSWPKRRWRAGGFGIHSPFAFSFVTGVLARKDIDGNVDKLRSISGNDCRQTALLYRCIRHFKPARIAVYPAGDETLTKVIRLACEKTQIVTDNNHGIPDMTVVGMSDDATLRDNGSPVYFVSHIDKEPYREFWKHLTACRDHGMDFTDGRTGIICRFSHLPRQSFKIVFK